MKERPLPRSWTNKADVFSPSKSFLNLCTNSQGLKSSSKMTSIILSRLRNCIKKLWLLRASCKTQKATRFTQDFLRSKKSWNSSWRWNECTKKKSNRKTYRSSLSWYLQAFKRARKRVSSISSRLIHRIRGEVWGRSNEMSDLNFYIWIQQEGWARKKRSKEKRRKKNWVWARPKVSY